jgi:hypothetical protein
MPGMESLATNTPGSESSPRRAFVVIISDGSKPAGGQVTTPERSCTMLQKEKHDDIITRASRPSPQSTLDDSTTLNESTPQMYAPSTCEVIFAGVACWHHAEIPYVTSEDITKMICKQCYHKLWGSALHLLKVRVQRRLQQDEGGRVA